MSGCERPCRAVTKVTTLGILALSCSGLPSRIRATNAAPLEARHVVREDSAPKADLRLVPPEVYMRTYLQLFGGLAPIDAQKRARGKDGVNLFDSWDDYVSALGFPDYRSDIPRQVQTNALMVAAFERLGVALCDRALEHDLKSMPPTPLGSRLVFDFDVPQAPLDAAGFATRFDVLHRTFLGYPVALAPAERGPRFYGLYQQIVARHRQASPESRFSPAEAGWAAVCYGLIRHPEFQLY
jgi:hypothetical protein